MLEVTLTKNNSINKSFIYMHNNKIKKTTFKAHANLKDLLKISFELIDFFFKDKVDKGGNPYIEHLKFVSDNVDGEYKIIGLLHDILEDTNCTPEILEHKGLPKYLVDSIVILTRKPNETYNEYIDRVIASNNKGAILTKKFDLIHNMDLSRLKNISKKDEDRVNKRYKPALEKINKCIDDL